MSSKDKILEYLELNKGTYISGESMATDLALSRTAIWKAINELRKSGYEIDAVSNKGYMLKDGNDIISAPGIISYLNGACLKKYQNGDLIRIYDTVNSTNRIAKELAIAGGDHGTIIIANEQTEGRGRKDHSFYSPKGGLYMSILLRPEELHKTISNYLNSNESANSSASSKKPEQILNPDTITSFTGGKVCAAIESLTGIRPRLKPINDLFIGDKKICGILTEAGTEFETGDVQWIVVGIGINFDSDVKAFPSDIKKTATSLFKPGEATFTKNRLAAEIIKQLIFS